MKVGVPLILLRNLDPRAGLTNGTRLLLREARPNVLDVTIITYVASTLSAIVKSNIIIHRSSDYHTHGRTFRGTHAGERAFIPRIVLTCAEENELPFDFRVCIFWSSRNG